MALDPVHDILPGLPIFTEDGIEVGKVKEIAPDRIKVDVSLLADYWVSREHVLSFTAERVTLDVPSGEIDTVKLKD
jgi:sporulation protein YlmC with PRC-barrel domain